ncbi:MAG: DUF1289 domain-containing protein [Pseudomonadota bacterium]
MSDAIWQRDEPQSPCVKLCSIHPVERICVGCLRSLEEIGVWSALSPDEQRRIIAELPERAPRLAKRRGTRRARRAGA